MFNVSPRHLLTRAGTGVAVLALVGVTGYSIGQSQVDSSVASAAPYVLANPASRPVLDDATPGSYANVVKAASPAVVTVRVDKKASSTPTGMQLPDDPLFREFFGRRFGQGPQMPRVPRQAGLGSGVIATADGYILTNNHVVEGADRVRVELTDRRTFEGKVVGTDPASDLALLKIEASDLPALPIGDSSRVNVGDIVLAIGNPLNVGQTVTMGIISAKGRATGVGDGSYEDFLQTDAPINQGNSGGALVNTAGELVGINSQILTPTGGNIGLGFAIPSNMVRNVMDQLKTEGKVVRGRLGVTVQNVTADMASSLGLSEVRGAIVSRVEAGSAAEKAGIERGDVIVAIGGEPVADNNELRNRVASTRPGTPTKIDVVRDGKRTTVTATIDRLTPEAIETAGGGNRRESGGYGMTVEPLTPETARSLQLPRETEGVVIREVVPDGAAAAAGLEAGDVIMQVNGQPVKSGADLKAALANTSGKPSLLLVSRRGTEVFVTIRSNS